MESWSREVFAKNLQYYIDITGVTQRDLAKYVGVSAPTLNEWVKGKKFPRIDRIEKLAAYFGCLKSDLIEDKKKPDAAEGTELSDNKRALMQLIQNCPEEDAGRLLQVLKLFLENAKQDS